MIAMSLVEALLAAGDSSGSGFTTPMPLVVFTVFFGPLPPWLPGIPWTRGHICQFPRKSLEGLL